MSTKTAERTETVTGPDLDPQPAQNLPATADPAAQFTQFNQAVRRMLGLEDATDGEIELFFHVCQKSGLDPFNKEVYMIGRNTEVDRWEPVDEAEPDGQKRKVKRWVTKYTIQTAINGFRKRAREIADNKGVEYSQDQPLWCGEDGIWKEVWPEKAAPVAAKFTVYRAGKPYTFVAHYSEYEQTKNDGQPNSMWKKMPRNQIRKCAEAGAIQAAFPDELGGLLLEDAVQNDVTVIDEDGNAAPAPQKRTQGGRGVDALRQRASGQVVESEADPAPAAPPSTGDMSAATRKKWLNRMFQLLGQFNVDEKTDQLIVIAALAGLSVRPLELEHRDGINDDQLRTAVNTLNGWEKAGTFDDEIREILNAATLDDDNQEN